MLQQNKLGITPAIRSAPASPGERSNCDCQRSAPHISPPWCTQGAATGHLEGAYLEGANLRLVKGVDCEDLKQTNGWEKALRDAKLACGADIPQP